MKTKTMVKVVGTVVVVVISAGGGLITGGLYLGDLAQRVSGVTQRVSGVEKDVATKLDKPMPAMKCDSYNSKSASKLERNYICPEGQFRIADWIAGDVENETEHWTLCCRYVTTVPHSLE